MEIFFYVLVAFTILGCACYYLGGCDDDEDDSYQNSNKESISLKQNQPSQKNETAINMGLLELPISSPRDQFPVNQNPAIYSEGKVPSYLPYSIAPNNVPSPVSGNQHTTWNNGSYMTSLW